MMVDDPTMPDTPIADRIVQAAADPLGPAAFVALGTVEGARDLARRVAAATLRELGDFMDYDPDVEVMSYGDIHNLANQIEQPATSGGGVLCHDSHGGHFPIPHYHPSAFWDQQGEQDE